MTMMDRDQRRWGRAAAACLVSGVLAACGGGDGDAGDALGGTAAAADASAGRPAASTRGLAAKRMDRLACDERLSDRRLGVTKVVYGTSTQRHMEPHACSSESTGDAPAN